MPEHVEKLIRIRKELLKAANAQKTSQPDKESYHLCRAEAMAEALEISSEEFNEHKLLIETEEKLEFPLTIKPKRKHEAATQKEKDNELYIVIKYTARNSKNKPIVNVFNDIIFPNKNQAQTYFDKFVDTFFPLLIHKTDYNDNTKEECKSEGIFASNGFKPNTKNYTEAACYLKKIEPDPKCLNSNYFFQSIKPLQNKTADKK